MFDAASFLETAGITDVDVYYVSHKRVYYRYNDPALKGRSFSRSHSEWPEFVASLIS